MSKSEDMRKKAENGAIEVIEELIEKYADAGRLTVNVRAHEEEILFNKAVRDYFVSEGFKVNGYDISWDKEEEEE